MFLNVRAPTHPARRSLDATRMARTLTSAAKTALVEQTRRIRLGHASFVLGLTLAVASAVSLGAFEPSASPARTQGAHEATHNLDVSSIHAAPLYVVLVDSQDKAKRLIAESPNLQLEASGSIALPVVRVITGSEDEHLLQDELAMIAYDGVDYRVTDLRKN